MKFRKLGYDSRIFNLTAIKKAVQPIYLGNEHREIYFSFEASLARPIGKAFFSTFRSAIRKMRLTCNFQSARLHCLVHRARAFGYRN